MTGGSLPPTHTTDIIHTLLAHMRGISTIEIISQQTTQFHLIVNSISETQVDPALIALGTIPVGILTTWLVLNVSLTFGTTSLWDNAAPIGALVGIAPTLLMTVEQLLRPAWHLRPVLLGTLHWLILLVGICEVFAIAVEDSLIERPAGVPPLAERLPAWLGRGLGIDHAHADSPDR